MKKNMEAFPDSNKIKYIILSIIFIMYMITIVSIVFLFTNYGKVGPQGPTGKVGPQGIQQRQQIPVVYKIDSFDDTTSSYSVVVKNQALNVFDIQQDSSISLDTISPFNTLTNLQLLLQNSGNHSVSVRSDEIVNIRTNSDIDVTKTGYGILWIIKISENNAILFS